MALVVYNGRIYIGVVSNVLAISVIKQRIAERRARRTENAAIIIAKQQDNAVIDAELSAWEEALHLIQSELDAAVPQPQTVRQRETLNTSTPQIFPQTEQRRGPRSPWKNIMPLVAQRTSSREFGLPDVMAVAEELGADVAAGTVRSQMANYVTSKMLNRVHAGSFTFTDLGLKVLAGIPDISEAEKVLNRDTPAVDDVQTAGVSQTDVTSVGPEASNVSMSVGADYPR